MLARIDGGRQVASGSRPLRRSARGLVRVWPVAQDFDADEVADGLAVETDLELPAVLHRLAVERDHDVAGPQSRAAAGLPGATSATMTP